MKSASLPIGDCIARLKCFLLLILWPVFPALAQVGAANLTGTVQDSTNANIPGASLSLINTLTGTENDSKTNGSGRFSLPGVIPGSYILRIERAGFATTQVTGLTLKLGDTRNLLIRMKVGSVSESVNVEASGNTVDATNAAVSTVVGRAFVRDLPLNGRSFQDLISATPGIVTPNPQTVGEGSQVQGDFSVNGQSLDANSFFVDGVAANVGLTLPTVNASSAATGSSEGSTALGTTQGLISVDALQEFRVLSSTYSAEYGRTPGGQFIFQTRSGTNAFHGSLYTYWRDYVVNGTDWFTDGLLPQEDGRVGIPFSQNDFGATFGGPVPLPESGHGRHKSFFFASYEGLLLSQPTPPAFEFVPSFEFQQLTPSAPLAVVLNYFDGGFEEPTEPTSESDGLYPASFAGYSLPARLNSTSIRLDQVLSPRLSLYLRYGNTPSFSESQQLSSLTTNRILSQAFTLGASSQIASAKSNDFRLGLVTSTSRTETEAGVYPGNSTFYGHGLNAALGIPAGSAPASADVYIHIPGIGESEIDTNSANSSLRAWNVRDTVTVQVANHLFKIGVDHEHVASTVIPASLSVQTDFLSYQSVLNNSASDIVVTKTQPSKPVFNEFSAFAEDQWRAKPSLTLSLGLRWEVDPPPHGGHGTDPYTALGDINEPSTLSVAPRGTPLWHTGWFNFAPRFGAAWKIGGTPGHEAVVRGGTGVFFDTATRAALGAFNSLGFASTAYYTNAPVPVTAAQLGLSTSPALPSDGPTVFAFPSHLQLPYSVQWSLGLEKALGRNQSLTASYVAAHGDRLLREQRRDLHDLNPNFGDVSFFPGGLTSSYQSLQVRFQRSMAHGLQALASYTWAHSLDYGSTDPFYPLIRGNSDLDIRHNLQGALSWSAPTPRGNWFLRETLGGWGFDGRLMARTAFPVTLFGNLFSDPFTGARYYSGVDRISGRPLYLYDGQYAGGRILNGGPDASNAAFSLPEGAAEGDAPRNFVRGFDAVQLNAAFQKTFPVFGSLNVQFRAEAFNVLNHPIFGYVDPFLSDEPFGQALKMLNQSFGGAGSLYQQGGPRSVQLSVRINF